MDRENHKRAPRGFSSAVPPGGPWTLPIKPTYQSGGYARITDEEAAVGRAGDPHEGRHPRRTNGVTDGRLLGIVLAQQRGSEWPRVRSQGFSHVSFRSARFDAEVEADAESGSGTAEREGCGSKCAVGVRKAVSSGCWGVASCRGMTGLWGGTRVAQSAGRRGPLRWLRGGVTWDRDSGG